MTALAGILVAQLCLPCEMAATELGLDAPASSSASMQGCQGSVVREECFAPTLTTSTWSFSAEIPVVAVGLSASLSAILALSWRPTSYRHALTARLSGPDLYLLHRALLT
jgi:hypothetical protein